jgi:hypothetical protein
MNRPVSTQPIFPIPSERSDTLSRNGKRLKSQHVFSRVGIKSSTAQNTIAFLKRHTMFSLKQWSSRIVVEPKLRTGQITITEYYARADYDVYARIPEIASFKMYIVQHSMLDPAISKALARNHYARNKCLVEKISSFNKCPSEAGNASEFIHQSSGSEQCFQRCMIGIRPIVYRGNLLIGRHDAPLMPYLAAFRLRFLRIIIKRFNSWQPVLTTCFKGHLFDNRNASDCSNWPGLSQKIDRVFETAGTRHAPIHSIAESSQYPTRHGNCQRCRTDRNSPPRGVLRKDRQHRSQLRQPISGRHYQASKTQSYCYALARDAFRVVHSHSPNTQTEALGFSKTNRQVNRPFGREINHA